MLLSFAGVRVRRAMAEVGLNGKGVTRRGFLRAAGAGAAWVALAGGLGCEPAESERRTDRALVPAPGEAPVRGLPPARPGETWTFRSRPDLGPSAAVVGTEAGGVAPGYVFLAPKQGSGPDGALILDNNADPIWFKPMPAGIRDVMDCKVQTYRGEPVLTFWEGVHGGYGQGEYVMLDGRYREVGRVRAGNGLDGDHHEFQVTKRDTALITIYAEVPYDLSPFGGPADGTVAEGVVQEIDIASGEVLLEWRSLKHVPLGESHDPLPGDPEAVYDYFHVNSIDVDADDNLLVSARKTFAVYKIDRETADTIWRLGGKNSDFEMGNGTRTLYQHDARRQADGTLTIFDNGAENVSEQSRYIGLETDEVNMRATLLWEHTHPDGVLALTQGNAQRLPNGSFFVGWGSAPVFSEHSGDGDLLFSASFPQGVESYRAFRHPWTGRPEGSPDVAASASEDGVILYASWNGATEVERWQVLTGPSLDQMEPVGSVPRSGFETAIAVRTDEPLIGARALDGSGQALGTSKAVNISR
jgi:hypothetical protein